MSTGQEASGTAAAVADSQPCQATADLTERSQRDVTPLLDLLVGRARRLTRKPADAEDLLQETLAKSYAGFRDGTNIRAWLFRIMTKWINTYRAAQRRPDEWLTDDICDAHVAAAAIHSASGLRSAEQEVLEALPDDDVRRALHALPDDQRLAVYYADVEGFRCQEIADITGAPFGHGDVAHIADGVIYAGCWGPWPPNVVTSTNGARPMRRPERRSAVAAGTRLEARHRRLSVLTADAHARSAQRRRIVRIQQLDRIKRHGHTVLSVVCA